MRDGVLFVRSQLGEGLCVTKRLEDRIVAEAVCAGARRQDVSFADAVECKEDSIRSDIDNASLIDDRLQ